jgi:hypothetical protein
MLLAMTERENASQRQKEGECLAMTEKESYCEHLKGAGQSPWLNSKFQTPNKFMQNVKIKMRNDRATVNKKLKCKKQRWKGISIFKILRFDLSF